MRDRLSLEEVGQPLACTGLGIRVEREAQPQRRRQFSTRQKATKHGFLSLCAPAIIANHGHLQSPSFPSSENSALCLEQHENSIEVVKQLLEHRRGKLPRRGFHASHHELPRLKQDEPEAHNFAVDSIQHQAEDTCLAIQTMRMTLQERTSSKPVVMERRQCASDRPTSPSTQRCEETQAARTQHAGSYLCNWGAVTDSCLDALVEVLTGLGWDKRLGDQSAISKTVPTEPPGPAGSSHCIFDLGCGDGRVVIEVCKRFSTARGVGVELNGSLVLAAQARAQRQGDDLYERCNFRQEDLTKMRDLASADVVFLYLPKLALQHVVGEVLPKSDLRNGTHIFTADEPLPDMPDLFSRVNRSRQNHEARRLFWYTWNNTRGSQNGPKQSWIPP